MKLHRLGRGQMIKALCELHFNDPIQTRLDGHWLARLRAQNNSEPWNRLQVQVSIDKDRVDLELARLFLSWELQAKQQHQSQKTNYPLSEHTSVRRLAIHSLIRQRYMVIFYHKLLWCLENFPQPGNRLGKGSAPA